jgi:hypothetical protein
MIQATSHLHKRGYSMPFRRLTLPFQCLSDPICSACDAQAAVLTPRQRVTTESVRGISHTLNARQVSLEFLVRRAQENLFYGVDGARALVLELGAELPTLDRDGL